MGYLHRRPLREDEVLRVLLTRHAADYAVHHAVHQRLLAGAAASAEGRS